MVGPALNGARVELRYPLNCLLSFHYFRNDDIPFLAADGLRIIGDSGAFSAISHGATIDIDEFHAWAATNRHALLWTAALDVVGDEAATWRNWQAAPSSLQLVPTVHYGCPPRTMDRYAEQGCTLIGLGGMVPFKSEPERLARWALSMFRYGRDQWPNVRFHGWGVSHRSLLFDLPWWSVDSSGFGASYRYGRLKAFDPRAGKFVSVWLGHRPRAAGSSAGHARLLRDCYGIAWQDILGSNAANQTFVARASAKSAQLLESFLAARHPVSAPERLAGMEDGTHVHVVDGSRHIMRRWGRSQS